MYDREICACPQSVRNISYYHTPYNTTIATAFTWLRFSHVLAMETSASEGLQRAAMMQAQQALMRMRACVPRAPMTRPNSPVEAGLDA